MPRNHNHAPARRVGPLAIGAAVLVLAGAAILPRTCGAEAPSSSNRGPVPVATDSGSPAPTPTELKTSASAATPESPAATSSSASPEATTPPPVTDPAQALRELVAKRYISCEVNSLTDGGKGEFSDQPAHLYTVGAGYKRDPASADARGSKPKTVDWQYPDLVPVGVDAKGKPDGRSFYSGNNDSDFDELDDKFGLPYKDIEKGAKAAVAVQTSATSNESDGSVVTTMVTQICEDSPVMTFNGTEWQLDTTPNVPLFTGPIVETVQN